MKPDSLLDSLIRRRYSPRQFRSDPIPDETLHELWQALRHAPSSFNEQPWRIIFARHADEAAFANILDCLVEKNQQWAKDAGVLMVIAAKKTFSMTGKPNRHAWYDCGSAVGTLVLKATELDLYVHQMAGFDPQKAEEVLGIPPEYEAVVALALGHNAETGKPEKARKEVSDIVFEGKFGQKNTP